MKAFFVLLLLSLLAFENSNAAISDQNIALGRWRQTCRNRNMNEEFFSSTQVRYSETYYSDDQCTQTLVSFVSEGPFQASQNKIDFIFASSDIIILSEQVAAGFNQRSVCGWTNWTTGRRAVLNQMCDFFNLGRNFPTPKTGQQKFGIYKLENALLFFGQLTKENDGSTDVRRPVQFNPRSYQHVN